MDFPCRSRRVGRAFETRKKLCFCNKNSSLETFLLFIRLVLVIIPQA